MKLKCLYCGKVFEGKENDPCPNVHAERDKWVVPFKDYKNAKKDYGGDQENEIRRKYREHQ